MQNVVDINESLTFDIAFEFYELCSQGSDLLFCSSCVCLSGRWCNFADRAAVFSLFFLQDSFVCLGGDMQKHRTAAKTE